MFHAPVAHRVSEKPSKSALRRPAADLIAHALAPLQAPLRPLANYLDGLERRLRANARPWVIAWIVFVVAMLALRLVNLRADYPLDYPAPQARIFLRDGFLYTDEGWYAAGALRWFRTGDWYLAGDLNIALVLPVHQLMHAAMFALMGPTIEAARLTGVVSMLLGCVSTYLLVRRFEAPWVAWLSVTLMATNLFFFAHNRVAIAENATLMWTTAAALAVAHATGRRAWVMATLAGLSLLAATLTKTPAILLAPFLALGIVGLNGWRSLVGWGAGSVFGAIVLGGYLAWQAFIAHHFPEDIAYFNLINVQMRSIRSLYDFYVTAYFFYYHLVFVDRTFYWFIMVGIGAMLLLSPRFRAHPLAVPALGILLWWFLAFTLYGNRQFRYFVAIGPAVAVLVAVGFAFVWRARRQSPIQCLLAWGLAICFAITIATNSAYIVTAMSFPRYSTAEAAHRVASTIERSYPEHRALLGHTACSLALFEDLVPINDQYMTGPLGPRLDALQPRVLIAEEPIDFAPWWRIEEPLDRDPRQRGARLAALQERYRIVELTRLRVLRNYSDRDFRLYRLDPLEPVSSGS